MPSKEFAERTALRARCERAAVLAIVLLTSGTSPVPGAQPVAAPAFTADLGYDQIGRILPGTEVPAPDSFAADAARIAGLPPMPSANAVYAAAEVTRALGSNPLTAIAAAPAAMALSAMSNAYQAKVNEVGQEYLRAGVMTRAWFFRGWTRTEMPRLHSVSIAKPDQGSEVFLDLTARTYREKAEAPQAGPAVETYVVSAADEVQISLTAAPEVKSLGTTVLAGVAARGYRTAATFSLSAALGLCLSGSHVMSEVEYVAVDVPDPQAGSGPAPEGSQLVRETCYPTTAASRHEPGRLVLFRSTAVTRGVVYPDFVSVMERGNLRPVHESDVSEFSIPPDFKRVP